MHGACFCGRFGKSPNYDEVETVLDETDFNLLMGKNVSIDDYNRIVNILTSDNGEAFYNEIIESEKEYMKDEYSLDDDDIETIFNSYYLDYRDRGVIRYVYDDAYDVGYEFISECFNIDKHLENYIDYEKFGQDMCDDENYIELSDGRIVSLSY